jgi:hypothetical protein
MLDLRAPQLLPVGRHYLHPRAVLRCLVAPSVHVSTRNWLQKQGLLGQWTQVAITRLLEVFPNHKYGSRKQVETITTAC